MPRWTKALDKSDKAVGLRVRLRRKLMNMSQTELAFRVGLKYQQIMRIEKGTSRLGPGLLSEIADALEAPIGYFFEGLQKPKVSSALIAEVLNDDPMFLFVNSRHGPDLAMAFLGIQDGDLQQRILSLVQELAGNDAKLKGAP